MDKAERAATAAKLERYAREEFGKYVGKTVLVRRCRAYDNNDKLITVFLSPAILMKVGHVDTGVLRWNKDWLDPVWYVSCEEEEIQLEDCTGLHIFATSRAIDGRTLQGWYTKYTWNLWFRRILRKLFQRT